MIGNSFGSYSLENISILATSPFAEDVELVKEVLAKGMHQASESTQAALADGD